MKAALTICGGTDYPGLKRSLYEVRLVRIVTKGSFSEDPVIQAAVILPPATELRLLDEIEDTFLLDPQDIFPIRRNNVQTAWCILFTRATDRSIDLIEQHLKSHAAISKVLRLTRTNKGMLDEYGYEPPPSAA